MLTCRLFDDAFSYNFLEPTFGFFNDVFPEISYYKEGSNLVLEAVLPGYEKEDLEVSVKDKIMTIKGKVSKENRYKKSFKKSFYLPSTVYDKEQLNIMSKLEKGILTVKIKNLYEKEKKKIDMVVNIE